MSDDRVEDEAWTVGRLLRWTTDYLLKHHCNSPRLEAEILLAHALDWPRVQLYMNINDVVGELGRSAFRELVKKRAAGEPVAYLVGHKEFYSLDFEVNRHVLIPRPDTETLVMTFLELASAVDAPFCVDIGTGSGCVAVSCAKHHPTARFVAIDLSPEAAEVARRNVARHKLTDRVEVRCGDLLEPLRPDEKPMFIVSNPPYIPTADCERLEHEVRAYEPHSALDGGPDGLDIVRRLVNQASEVLLPGGFLLIEIGYDQADSANQAFSALPGWQFDGIKKDLAGHPRVMVLKQKKSGT